MKIYQFYLASSEKGALSQASYPNGQWDKELLKGTNISILLIMILHPRKGNQKHTLKWPNVSIILQGKNGGNIEVCRR